MKKLKLNPVAYQGEVLTRSQLKKVVGGVGSLCDSWYDAPNDICFNCCLISSPGAYEGCGIYCQ